MLITTGMALGILTFVMLSTHFFRAFSLLSRGVPLGVLFEMIFLLLPSVLRFALPLALLVSTVLVYSRMSADSEIIALKSMGVSIWQTVMPAMVISLVFSALGVWISFWVAPACRYLSENLQQEAIAEAPLILLEPGHFSEAFPGCAFRVGAKNGNQLQDIHIVYPYGGKNKKRCQDIVAKSGELKVDRETECFELTLRDASVTDFAMGEAPTPEDTKVLKTRLIKLPYSYASDRKKNWSVLRKAKYLNLREACAKVYQEKQNGRKKEVTSILLDLHSRMAMALSPFAFLLLGIPFAIRNRRSELSVGLLYCVLLALVFYAFSLLSNTMKNVPGVQYVIWIPNLAYQVVGLIMLKKLEKNG